MKHNPFVPREQRTAILTFDNGQRVRAEMNGSRRLFGMMPKKNPNTENQLSLNAFVI